MIEVGAKRWLGTTARCCVGRGKSGGRGGRGSGMGGRGGGAYCIGVSAGLLVKAAPGPPAPLKQWDQPRSEEQDVRAEDPEFQCWYPESCVPYPDVLRREDSPRTAPLRILRGSEGARRPRHVNVWNGGHDHRSRSSG